MANRISPKSPSKAFGTALKKLRKERGMTQEELGEALNVQKSCISNYEKFFSMPDISRLLAIAEFFHVSDISTLLGYVPKNVVNESGSDNRRVPIIYSADFNSDPFVPGNMVDEMILPNINLKSGDYFGFIIPDNSMSRSRIKKGDIALFRRQSVVSTGDVALIVTRNGDTVIRKIYIINDDILSLQPDSEDNGYIPLTFKLDSTDYKILGKLTYLHVSF